MHLLEYQGRLRSMNKSAMVCATRVPCFARKVQSASTLKVVPSAFRLLLSAASLRELQNKQRHVTAIDRRVELGNSTESTFIHFYDGCSSSASCGRRHSGPRLPEQPDTGGCQ